MNETQIIELFCNTDARKEGQSILLILIAFIKMQDFLRTKKMTFFVTLDEDFDRILNGRNASGHSLRVPLMRRSIIFG